MSNPSSHPGEPPSPDPSILALAGAVVMLAGKDNPYAQGAAEKAMRNVEWLYGFACSLWYKNEAYLRDDGDKKFREKNLADVAAALEKFKRPAWSEDAFLLFDLEVPKTVDDLREAIFDHQMPLPFSWWGRYVTNQKRADRSLALIENSPIARFARGPRFDRFSGKFGPSGDITRDQTWTSLTVWREAYARHMKTSKAAATTKARAAREDDKPARDKRSNKFTKAPPTTKGKANLPKKGSEVKAA